MDHFFFILFFCETFGESVFSFDVYLILQFIWLGKPGKWVTEEEAFSSSQLSSSLDSRNSNASNSRKPLSTSEASPTAEDNGATKNQSGPPPGLVVPSSLNPMRSVKGAPSSVAVKKRKRVDEKPKVMSKEEAAALKAREAAKKRMEEREKPLLGLYKSY